MSDSIERLPKSERLCVVTGASAGIGAQCAIDLAAQGHPILLLARRLEKMQDLICSGKIPTDRGLAISCDVRDFEAIKSAIARAEEHFGCACDLMVNNAGVFRPGQIVDLDLDTIDLQVDTNLRGVVNGCKAVIPGMIERKRGMIVNVSSTAGRKTGANYASYAMTKYGVRGFSEGLRQELAGSGVRLTVISPGMVETDIFVAGGDVENSQLRSLPFPPLIPEDVSSAVSYAYSLPERVCIREIILSSTGQV